MALYGIDADNASPASNGGRGLKHHSGLLAIRQAIGIARQQWRARIETLSGRCALQAAGRIARQQWRARIETWTTALMSCAAKRIARQQWRARIETSSPPKVTLPRRASPASNGGRGLKPRNAIVLASRARIARQQWRARIETANLAQRLALALGHRPPAMAGAD